jgi:hypothetical protein
MFPIRIGSESFLPAASYRLDYQVRKPKVDLYGKKTLKEKKQRKSQKQLPQFPIQIRNS